MRVGLDCDGVIYDFVSALRARIAKARHQPQHQLADPTCWEYWDEWSLTEKEWRTHFAAGVKDGDLFNRRSRPLDHGAINVIYNTHSVHIVTDRPKGAHGPTRDWLHKNRIRYDTLTFTSDKTTVPTDVFLDDKPENVEALLAVGVDAVLLDRPWNRGPNANGLHRVYNWREFIKFIKAAGG